MSCPSCQTQSRNEYKSEIAVHFSGRENLNKPHVFLFPTILICMNCGFAEFRVEEKDLRELATRSTLARTDRASE